MLKIYGKNFLTKILNASKRHAYIQMKNQQEHFTYDSLHNIFSSYRLRAYFILKIKYPQGILNYYSEEHKFIYTMYVPDLDLYIDLFTEIEHKGPYDVERPFNPLNLDDVKFVEDARNYHNISFSWYKKSFYRKSISKYWVAIAKATTWGNYDYKKYRYMKMKNLNYKIYWNIEELESTIDKYYINLSYSVVSQYYNLILLQNAVYKNVDELLIATGKSNGILNLIDIE